MSTTKPRVYVFIDASNLWQVQKAKGKMFDYEKLKNFLLMKYKAAELKIFYYAAYPKQGTREYSQDAKHKFFTYLKKRLGYTVRKKELKRIHVHSVEGDTIEEKGNMDVEMTIDVVHNIDNYDISVLFTGDSDFLGLVNYVKNRGKQVFIFSSRNNISQELRTGGDGYTDVLMVEEDIWGRDLRYRQN